MTLDLSFELNFFESLIKRDPKNLRATEILAQLYTESGQISNGLKMDRKLVRMAPDNPLAHYNLACSLSLKKRKKEAVETLEKAIDLGYSDFAWMNEDPDLIDLAHYQPFQELVQKHINKV